jgi:hypothetical protein
MQNKHADKLTFRAWLVKQLKITRWSVIANESREDLANRLGVTREVLERATDERAEELMDRGKLPRQLGKRRFNQSDYFDLAVTMPPEIHAEWTLVCKSLHVSQSCVLRTLIHQFLLTKERPTTTGGTWLYRGRLHTIKPKGRQVAKTRITRGAQIALDHYADRWNVTVTGIVRGIITDFLKPGAEPLRFKLIAFSVMWGDPARYLDEPLKAGGQEP